MTAVSAMMTYREKKNEKNTERQSAVHTRALRLDRLHPSYYRIQISLINFDDSERSK